MQREYPMRYPKVESFDPTQHQTRLHGIEVHSGKTMTSQSIEKALSGRNISSPCVHMGRTQYIVDFWRDCSCCGVDMN